MASPGSQQQHTFGPEAMVQPQVISSYTSYDPNRVHMMGQFVQPQQPQEAKLAEQMASMPVGSQFVVPRGSVPANPFGTMQGSATPPMAPGSGMVANPFASSGN